MCSSVALVGAGVKSCPSLNRTDGKYHNAGLIPD